MEHTTNLTKECDDIEDWISYSRLFLKLIKINQPKKLAASHIIHSRYIVFNNANHPGDAITVNIR
jgi:hypothetical protein